MNGIQWCQVATRWALSVASPFAGFLRRSLTIESLGFQPGTELLPAPLPPLAPARAPVRSRRGAHRAREQRAIACGLRLLVVAVNFLYGNRRGRVPVEALRRAPNAAQLRMYARFGGLLRSWGRGVAHFGASCGRRGMAFAEHLFALEELAGRLREDLDPYGAIRLSGGGLPDMRPARGFDAERLRFPQNVADFHGEHWLEEGLVVPFLEPAVLARSDFERVDWTHPRVDGRDRAQYLKLFRQWATARRFALLRGGLPSWRIASIFNVWKIFPRTAKSSTVRASMAPSAAWILARRGVSLLGGSSLITSCVGAGVSASQLPTCGTIIMPGL